MNDLSEALARADKALHYDLGWQIDPDSADTIVAAARNWHTLPPVWEQAHRLRDALLDSFNDHEIRTMAELFELVMDDGVTQAWVRALTDTTDDE